MKGMPYFKRFDKNTILKASLFVICCVTLIVALFVLRRTPSAAIFQKEQFAGVLASSSNPVKATIVYTTMQLNNADWIRQSLNTNITYRDVSSPTSYDTFTKVITSNQMASLEEPNITGNIMYIANPYEVDTLLAGRKILKRSPEGYYIAFGLLGKTFKMDCSFQLANKNIGYFTDTDYMFINAILNGHRIDKSNILFSKIDIYTLTNPKITAETILSDIDIVIAYIIPFNPIHMWLLNQRVAFMGFKKLDINRVNLFYPYTTMKPINIRTTIFGNNKSDANANSSVTATVSEEENETMLPTMKLSLVELLNKGGPSPIIVSKPVKASKPSTFNTKENFITRLSLSPESLDPTYRCYGDVTTTTKALCDSPYDELGQPKQTRTVWDHPCLANTDCPFYKANTNYENSRGGCDKQGQCELPIGVRRTSFRKYNDTGIFAPFCYGCDAYDTECCSQQSQPDYAFENDTAERRSAELKTIIPMN